MLSTLRGRCVSRYMRLPRLSLNPGLLFRKLRIGCVLLAPGAAAGRRRAASKSGSRAVVDPLLSSYYKNDVWGLFLAPGTSSLIRASPAARIPDFAPSGHQTVRGVSTLPSTFRGRHVSRCMRLPRLSLNSGLLFRKLRTVSALLLGWLAGLLGGWLVG